MASVAVRPRRCSPAPTRGAPDYFEQLSFWRNPIGRASPSYFQCSSCPARATGGQSTVSYLGGIKAIQYYVAGSLPMA